MRPINSPESFKFDRYRNLLSGKEKPDRNRTFRHSVIRAEILEVFFKSGVFVRQSVSHQIYERVCIRKNLKVPRCIGSHFTIFGRIGKGVNEARRI